MPTVLQPGSGVGTPVALGGRGLLRAGAPVVHSQPCGVQILVGNKCDIDESKRAVPYSKGQALANEFGIKFFETSAKSNINVDEVRFRIKH